MDMLVNLIRIVTAVITPLSAIAFAFVTALRVAKDRGELPGEGQLCLRCEGSGRGAKGHFYYTENINNSRDHSVWRQLSSNDSPVLGEESHFICDRCAFRYIRSEIFQLFLMVLPYPVYLYVIVSMFAENGIFANFLIETLLVVLSVSGFVSALDLLRAVQFGKTPLAEARDRVAICERKNTLGKKFNYYTRLEFAQLKK
jgi:hypothetical protein